MANPHPTPKFLPGNQAALGNDKTLRISQVLNNLLDQPAPRTLKEYEEGMSKRQVLANQLLNKALKTKDAKLKLDYARELFDRAEGKPKQQTDITSNGESVQVTVFVPEKYKEEELSTVTSQ